jgi:multiple sugar transport system permease protein
MQSNRVARKPSYLAREYNREQVRLAFLLVGPSMLIILGLTFVPIFFAFYLSLHEISLLRPGATFIGLGNYWTMVQDPEVIASLARTLYFTAASLVLQVGLGLLTALVLNESFPGRGWLRGLIILPWAIPTVVNALLWEWIYNPNYSVLNALLLQLGIIHQNIQWLARPFIALNSVLIADTWRVLPFYVIMFLGALQAVPMELYEAAKVDGATAFGRFWNVTLPFLRHIILVILVLRTVQILRVFDIIYIMTKGGPANGTMVISFLTYYESFKFLNFGYGAALAFAIALVTFAISAIYVRLLSSDD